MFICFIFTDAQTLATTLQQHICYALHAVTLFRQHPSSFSQVFKYLESHRETSVTQQSNVAVPNALLLQNLHQRIMSHQNSSATHSHSRSTASSASLPSTAAASPSNARSNKKYASDHCGNFNSREGCKYGSACNKPHICRECKSAAHNKTTCPVFKQKQASKSKRQIESK